MNEPQNEASAAESGTLTKVASIVPEIFYDLIARVVPGFCFVAILAGTYIAETGVPHFEAKAEDMGWTASTIILLIALLLAYGIGHLLTPIGDALSQQCRYPILLRAARHESALVHELQTQLKETKLSLEKMRWFSPKDRRALSRLYERMHAYLKRQDEQSRVLLPKSQAEAALSSNLLGGFVLAAIIDGVYRYHTGVPFTRLFWGVWVAFILLTAWTNAYRTLRLINKHFAYLAQVIAIPTVAKPATEAPVTDKKVGAGGGL
ncbi:MAG TPA: hypothetical protein VGL89_15450 [Candidatus Koribacter sp.]|jgi:hypothetical protein